MVFKNERQVCSRPRASSPEDREAFCWQAHKQASPIATPKTEFVVFAALPLILENLHSRLLNYYLLDWAIGMPADVVSWDSRLCGHIEWQVLKRQTCQGGK